MSDGALWMMGAGVSQRPSVGRLSVSGPYFVDAQGAIVIRRSVTGFALSKRYATGRADDARAYLDWAAAKGFTEVRVFTQTNWDGPPHIGVETGWDYDEAACEQALIDAAARGLRLELVAHTYAYDIEAMVQHLAAVDALCLRHENALLEVGNEISVNHIPLAAILGRYTPSNLAWASGLYDCPPYPAGPALTYHSPRKDSWARCFKDAWEFHEGSGPTAPFSPPFRGPVMLDEPPQCEQTIRDAPAAFPAADDWEAYGAGAAFFAAGATLHGNPQFQKCEIPTDPSILACVDAFIRGFGAVPVQAYERYDRGDPPNSDEGSRRYFRWSADGRKWQITVRPFSFRQV